MSEEKRDVRKIRIEDYDYPLPEGRIASHPLAQRDSCRLLVVNGAGRMVHSVFSRLPLFMRPDTLVVANETKVIHARMEFVKDTGAKIEIFLLEPMNPVDYVTSFASRSGCVWKCLVGNKKRWKEGVLTKKLMIDGKETTLAATLGEEVPGGGCAVAFSWVNPDVSFAEVVEVAGSIPIPPYLKRESEESDTSDYQTVYSTTSGSVAAPTAGLHFTPELIQMLRREGHEFATVTLHVGAGTFQPVKSDEIGDHPMHSEWMSVSRKALRLLIGALENGRDVMAVGTTSVRTLESLPYLGALAARKNGELRVEQWMPYQDEFKSMSTLRCLHDLLDYMKEEGLESIEAQTSIMIAPGFRWRIVDRLVTNFHQPKSTLLLLVASFLGTERGGMDWRNIYEEALDKDYRFLSYGDACLFTRGRQPVELPASKSMVLRSALIQTVRNPQLLHLLDKLPVDCDDVSDFIRGLKYTVLSSMYPGHLEVKISEGAAPLRFLVAFAASLPGAKIVITAGERLRERPILPLVDTLRGMGAQIEFDDSPGEEWGIAVSGQQLQGGDVEIDSSVTSQFVSALMMVSPLWTEKLTVKEKDGADRCVSRPYVRMTEKMMAMEHPPVEPDWSAAAFFYDYVLVSGKGMRISKLIPPAESLQGDAAACDLFGRIGVNTRFEDGGALLTYDPERVEMLRDEEGLECDFTDTPDLVPAVAVALCYRRIPFRFHGIHHLRYKESDRVAALHNLLVILGYGVSVEGESLVFNGEFTPAADFPVEIEPYSDHRIAMAFYPLELAGMVKVEDKGVITKSFPDFYQQF